MLWFNRVSDRMAFELIFFLISIVTNLSSIAGLTTFFNSLKFQIISSYVYYDRLDLYNGGAEKPLNLIQFNRREYFDSFSLLALTLAWVLWQHSHRCEFFDSLYIVVSQKLSHQIALITHFASKIKLFFFVCFYAS